MNHKIFANTRRRAWLVPIALVPLLAVAGCGSAATSSPTSVSTPGLQAAGTPSDTRSAAPVAAVGGGTPTSPANSSTAGSQAAGSNTDRVAAYKAVCALFTRDEAQAVVGDTAQLAADPAPYAEMSAGGVLGIGDATSCEYWTVPPDGQGLPADITQNLHGFPALYVAVDTKLVSWQLVLTNKKREALSGLGSEAYYVPSQLEGDKSGGYLVAHKGARYLWISRGQFAGDAAPDVKDREITLARSILSKI